MLERFLVLDSGYKGKTSGPFQPMANFFIVNARRLPLALIVYTLVKPPPISPAPVPAQAGQQVATEALAAHAAWVRGSKEIAGNYNMHGMGKTVNELHAMLKLHEQTLPKKDAPALHVIRAGKRNFPQYLAKLLKNKKLSQRASGSSIFTIELYTFPNKSWVYDTGCVTHICNTTQGLRESSKLKPGALSLYVGNDNDISVSRNNLVYFNVVPRDGIFEIDLSNSNTNDSSMYAVSNKRAKLNLDSALLWHCCLGYISKKRIEKLQHDGLLNSIDLKAFEKCVSYPEFDKWLNAMNVKMQSMKDNEVYVLVDLPPNGKTRFHMDNSKRESIPMQEKLKLSKSQGASTLAKLKRMQNVPYASVVGSIMYAVRCTPPDVAFAQNITPIPATHRPVKRIAQLGEKPISKDPKRKMQDAKDIVYRRPM
nr:hypothetical protein [Tanacetum cinerariifolium]